MRTGTLLVMIALGMIAFTSCQKDGFTNNTVVIRNEDDSVDDVVENNKLFERFVDPVSKVVSYRLLYGDPGDCCFSLYFTIKSMTDDGRYLVFKFKKGDSLTPATRYIMVADLKTGQVHQTCTLTEPFVDVKDNYMIYGRSYEGGWALFRRNFDNPEKEIKLQDAPSAVKSRGTIVALHGHLTLSKNRKKAFIDPEVITPDGKDIRIYGLFDLETGAWDPWGEDAATFTHAQLCPSDDSVALFADEDAMNKWNAVGRVGGYPRMWLVRKGSKEMVPAKAKNICSHEIWDDDGKGFSWCGSGEQVSGNGVYHHDLATGNQKLWADVPGARHNTCSTDNQYVVCTQSVGEYWGHGSYRVAFWNRNTGKYVWLYSTRPALNPKGVKQAMGTNPHPRFVMNGKYVVTTAYNDNGTCDIFVTPTKQMIKMTQ